MIQDIARIVQESTARPTGPTVWILSKGEMHEGGQIRGVYLDPALAAGDFLTAVTDIDIQELRQPDGGLEVLGRCDWVALEPHAVKTKPELNT